MESASNTERELSNPRNAEVVQGKGAMLRGFLLALDEAGLRKEVHARVSPRTAVAMDHPPPVSAWIDPAPMEEIIDVVASLRGIAAVRAVNRSATLIGLAPIMRTVVEGLLRIFGVSPFTLFARLRHLSSGNVRGVEYRWRALSPTSGELTVRYPRREAMSWNVLVGIAGTLEAVFDVCGAIGRVSHPRPLEDGRINGARYVVEIVRAKSA